MDEFNLRRMHWSVCVKSFNTDIIVNFESLEITPGEKKKNQWTH